MARLLHISTYGCQMNVGDLKEMVGPALGMFDE